MRDRRGRHRPLEAQVAALAAAPPPPPGAAADSVLGTGPTAASEAAKAALLGSPRRRGICPAAAAAAAQGLPVGEGVGREAGPGEVLAAAELERLGAAGAADEKAPDASVRPPRQAHAHRGPGARADAATANAATASNAGATTNAADANADAAATAAANAATAAFVFDSPPVAAARHGAASAAHKRGRGFFFRAPEGRVA